MTVASAELGKCAGCVNRMACAARRANQPQARSAVRALDLISAIGCFAFVVFVLISTLAPLLRA